MYDTSGAWGDPDFHGDVTQGLPPLRAKWIRERGDVKKSMDGSRSDALDDGYLSRDACRASAAPQWKLQIPVQAQSNFKPQSNIEVCPAQAIARDAPVSRDATGVRQAWHHHARDGIHRRSRESGERTRLACRIRRLAECFLNCPQFLRPSARWRIIWREHPATR